MQYTRLLFVCCYYSFVCLFISGGENKAEKKEQVLDFRKATFQEICANNEKKVWGRYQDFFWRMRLILLVCIKKGRNIKILWIPCKDFFSFQVFLSTSILSLQKYLRNINYFRLSYFELAILTLCPLFFDSLVFI